MKELFKRTATSVILSSVVAFIIGLIMVVAPNMSLQTIGIIAGVYIIIHGVVLIGLAFAANVLFVPFFGVISGILSVVLGIVLVAMPEVLSTIFGIALGVWIILSSANIISISIAIKNVYSNWGLLLLLGVVDLICGVIILFNPFASSLSIVVLGGIIIMVHSVITLTDMLVIKNNVKEISKALGANFKEVR